MSVRPVSPDKIEPPPPRKELRLFSFHTMCRTLGDALWRCQKLERKGFFAVIRPVGTSYKVLRHDPKNRREVLKIW